MSHKLLIISDTKMQSSNGSWRGFNSVVLELQVFQKIFNKITWIGSDYSLAKLDNALLAVPSDIPCIALPIIGGKSLWKKLVSIPNGMLYAYHMLKELPQSDIIHVRGPNAVMFISMLIAPFFKKKKWWFKYANNWVDPKPPLFWGIQKKLMRYYTFSVGTVNGLWDGEPKHIKAFNNPCITLDLIRKSNVKQLQFSLLFVGRIEFEKGIKVIIECLKHLDLEQKRNIQKVTFIGNGKDIEFLKTCNIDSLQLEILGKCPKEEVFKKMSESTYLLLPTTASEGFPKVIAEAWSQGCLPITTDISSIAQVVINGKNGFVANRENLQKEFFKALVIALSLTNDQIKDMQLVASAQLEAFTYETYRKRIISEIIL